MNIVNSCFVRMSAALIALAAVDVPASAGTVRDVAITYAPAPGGDPALTGLRIAVAPVQGRTDVARHTANVDRAHRGLGLDEQERLLGIGFNAYQRPLLRFVADRSPAEALHAALVAELGALGAVPTSDAPDLLMDVAIVDVFFETRPGFTQMTMMTSLEVALTVTDAATRALVWSGPVRFDQPDQSALALTTNGAEERFASAFTGFVEALVRDNVDLHRALLQLRRG